MATHGRAERAVATVERLLELPERWPVIVVDDASPDDTTPRLRARFGDQIRVVRLDDNRGSAARNVGVALAGTDVVAFSDDDSWWDPGALAAAARLLESAPEVGLVAAAICVEPEGRVDPVTHAMAASPLAPTPWGPSILGFLACGAIVRARAFLEVGGFDPLMHIGGEEELLALDLRSAGWQLVHAPGIVAHHAPEAGDAGRERRTVRLARNSSWVRLLRRSPSVAARSLARLARDAPHSPVARQALRETLPALPRLLRARRPVPPLVEAAARALESSTRHDGGRRAAEM